MNELIIVEQLPIIKEKLKQISDEIDVKTTNALSLVCTEDTVKEIKVLRADLNKDFKELEEKRKSVKKQVLSPYEQFEEVYKKYVSDKFKNADVELKNKIDEVEDNLKKEKELEIITYFNEYLQSKSIDFITYEMANINVTLSASLKSLKEQAKAFIDRVSDDLALIDTQEFKSEILVEYKRSLNVSQAITTVSARLKAIEEEKAKIEPKIDEAKENIKPQQNEIPVEKVNVQSMSILVTGTPFELDRLRKFLNEYEYDWEVEL